MSQLVLKHHLALQSDATPRLSARHVYWMCWPGWIAQAVDYLDAHFAEIVLLQQMAAAVNVSPFHLLRTFRDQVSVPPHMFLAQLRIRHAKRLLLQGHLIVQVAAETGFSDQSHLTRCFRQGVGITPGQYWKIRARDADTKGILTIYHEMTSGFRTADDVAKRQ